MFLLTNKLINNFYFRINFNVFTYRPSLIIAFFINNSELIFINLIITLYNIERASISIEVKNHEFCTLAIPFFNFCLIMFYVAHHLNSQSIKIHLKNIE